MGSDLECPLYVLLLMIYKIKLDNFLHKTRDCRLALRKTEQSAEGCLVFENLKTELKKSIYTIKVAIVACIYPI
jgi:hypothetical protein